MKGRKCPTCGEAFRKGKRRVVLHYDGSIAAQTVCPACVGRSVSIVVPFARAGLQVHGVELLERVSNRLRSQLHAIKLVEVLPGTVEPELSRGFTKGRVETLEATIDLIQRAIAGVLP